MSSPEWVQEINRGINQVLSQLHKGSRVMIEGRPATITGGEFLDSIYGRLSNYWDWTWDDEEKGQGYGSTEWELIND